MSAGAFLLHFVVEPGFHRHVCTAIYLNTEIRVVFTRECHVLRPERTLRAADVLAWLERAIKAHGAPTYLRRDNGPEFIAKEVQRCA